MYREKAMKKIQSNNLKFVLGLMLAVSVSSVSAIPKTVVGTGNANENSHSPDLAVDSQGRIHTVWMEQSSTLSEFDVMYRLLAADGTEIVAKTQLSDSTVTSDSQGHPAIAVDDNDHAYVSWFDANDTDGFFVGLNNGVEKFSPVTVTDCKRSNLAVGSGGNIHMACASDNGDVQMQVFGADGTTITASYVVTDSVVDQYYGVSRIHMALDRDRKSVV